MQIIRRDFFTRAAASLAALFGIQVSGSANTKETQPKEEPKLVEEIAVYWYGMSHTVYAEKHAYKKCVTQIVGLPSRSGDWEPIWIAMREQLRNNVIEATRDRYSWSIWSCLYHLRQKPAADWHSHTKFMDCVYAQGMVPFIWDHTEYAGLNLKRPELEIVDSKLYVWKSEWHKMGEKFDLTTKRTYQS